MVSIVLLPKPELISPRDQPEEAVVATFVEPSFHRREDSKKIKWLPLLDGK